MIMKSILTRKTPKLHVLHSEVKRAESSRSAHEDVPEFVVLLTGHAYLMAEPRIHAEVMS